ncbi:hypothetical protein, partial [Dialister invisus]|uniref:hypothetical protein n=1 Tax=Dialister invisus TaxID=218538 RepID=UPI003AB59B61
AVETCRIPLSVDILVKFILLQVFLLVFLCVRFHFTTNRNVYFALSASDSHSMAGRGGEPLSKEHAAHEIVLITDGAAGDIRLRE